ncbi:MAG: tRNA epoxyqueuosine(34) reductase QueG [Bdellovibrio sp.]|nr:MAG: tRNA epoxyqueuosine(34) reductase QueG [Bdellovibrio sp.]
MVVKLLENLIQEAGFEHFNWVPLRKPLSMDIYKAWVQEGLHGEMHYLKEHLPFKETPQKLLPSAQTAIVFAVPYQPHPFPSTPLPSLNIAAYAKGKDYHLWLQKKLKHLCKELQKHFPQDLFLPMTDSKPVLERDLAVQGGLGWIGKNSCLIVPKKGSYFFIAEIYTTLTLNSRSIPNLSTDLCGRCTRCIDACPTKALRPNRTMDARRCISYMNIESKSIPPPELRASWGSWFFGCDICQQVCPWNIKVYGAPSTPSPSREGLIRDLLWILKSSNKKLLKTLKDTPLIRARATGLKRNAMIIATHFKLHELKEAVMEYIDHPQLGELSNWTLKQIDSANSSSVEHSPSSLHT